VTGKEEFLNERGREFSYEGKRREDLIRFGKYTEARWEKRESGKFREIFPIPMNILVANPGLVQNPGY
jgi:starch-binding outer membrane protein, SusD/RagB family